MRTLGTIALAATALLLASCTAPGGTPEPDPDVPPAADVPCIVGTWQLDVANYAAQAEEYVLTLGLPIEGFGMTGAGTITFTANGLVSTEVDLTTTGTIVAGETAVPLYQRSVYAATGDWAEGSDADAIDLENWATVSDPTFPIDPEAPAPAIDYTAIPTVLAPCTPTELVLLAPDAQLAAVWHR